MITSPAIIQYNVDTTTRMFTGIRGDFSDSVFVKETDNVLPSNILPLIKDISDSKDIILPTIKSIKNSLDGEMVPGDFKSQDDVDKFIYYNEIEYFYFVNMNVTALPGSPTRYNIEYRVFVGDIESYPDGMYQLIEEIEDSAVEPELIFNGETRKGGL